MKIGDLIRINEGYEYLKAFPSEPILIVEEYLDNSRLFPERMFKMLYGEKTWIYEAELVESIYDLISPASL